MDVDLRWMVGRVKDGDLAAFRRIVDATRAPLYRLAARLTSDLAEAEDALQDAYLGAYRAIREGRYDGRARVETWLYRIVTNAAIDALRKRKTRAAGDAPREPRYDGQVKADARVALRELDAMVAQLSPHDRAAIILVAVEGLTVKEAAAALDCTEGAVEQRLVRARAALRSARSEEETRHE